ncbi:ABC transporter ATP-binding protein [Paracoccus lutimaris]|uniref:Peptide/nickel transport system ATP-binding protein n=1 Tax=Paracoccus lutimaris TaxID=1490030 RepID=A0A368Z2W2_9RHOB|nr:ABC transporter ATP-binding protein [Paracoccus lutimaris]RCW86792.1 peptide/nickel transport system ATP-binding protein [Paracoccus lutimaris]
MTLLTVRDLRVDYFTTTRVIHAVRGASFDLAPAERVALVGESGSGKTTTALALMQMIDKPGRITGGNALLKGQDLLALDHEQMRRARLSRVAYIPQGAMNALNPVMRIRDQMLDGMADHGRRMGRAEARDFVAAALEGVGLPADVGTRYPHQLSGGMKQRACIAISIAMKPDLIIADEPTSALDVITQQQVMETLIAAQEQIGCGLLLIGHDMGLMAQATHRVIVMQDGLIAEDAPVDRIFTAPRHPYSRMLIESVPSLGDVPQDQVREPQKAGSAAVLAMPATGDAGPSELLRFDHVGKTFRGGFFGGGDVRALAPVSFALAADTPQIVSVVGQSGSGKTTLARLILGFESPSEGRILWRGQPVDAMGGRARAGYRQQVQAVFQDPYGSFNPFYQVDRTLKLPLVNFDIAAGTTDRRRRVEAACSAVGLNADEVLGRFPHELSGGQRQRLMVARALMIGPPLLVADEPVSMVDASLRMTILNNIRELKDQFGISVIYITHDLATAYHVSDYVLVMHQGRIVEAGPPRAVIKTPGHPYTRALVGAIPWPDPSRGWPPVGRSRAGWDAAPVIHGGYPGFVLESGLARAA